MADEAKPEVKAEEAAAEVKAEKAAEVKAEEPAAEVKAEEPAEVKAEEPAAEVKAEEPAAEVKAEEPAAEVKAEETAAEVKAEEPAAEVETNDVGMEDVKAEDEAGEEDKADGKRESSGPVQLGFKSFENGELAASYFHGLITNYSQEQDLNEYEHEAMLDLIKKGHPKAGAKIGCGVKAFQIMKHEDMGSVCFYLYRTDGTSEDFSYLKCLQQLFPGEITFGNKKQRSDGGRGRGRGGRGGRGRGGRGRGRGRRGRGH